MLSATIKAECEYLLVYSTGEKLTFENLPWVATIPGQTIDRCIKVSCDAYHKLVTVNLRLTNRSSNLALNNAIFTTSYKQTILFQSFW